MGEMQAALPRMSAAVTSWFSADLMRNSRCCSRLSNALSALRRSAGDGVFYTPWFCTYAMGLTETARECEETADRIETSKPESARLFRAAAATLREADALLS